MTEKVYRFQLQPVITKGAETMNAIFGDSKEVPTVRWLPVWLPPTPKIERAPEKSSETLSDLRRCVVGDTGIEPVSRGIERYWPHPAEMHSDLLISCPVSRATR